MPRFLPPWAEDLRFLVSYLAYSSFLNRVRRGEVSATTRACWPARRPRRGAPAGGVAPSPYARRRREARQQFSVR